jgi:hypothetical protein
MNVESRECVNCHQPLPLGSKLTLTSVSQEEAERNGWIGQENSDGTLTVDMCLQCQINRSKNKKEGSSVAS